MKQIKVQKNIRQPRLFLIYLKNFEDYFFPLMILLMNILKYL